MKPKAYVGWDIGASGAIVVLSKETDEKGRRKVLRTVPGKTMTKRSGRSTIPDVRLQNAEILKIRDDFDVQEIAIEQQAPRPKEGSVSAHTSAAFMWSAWGQVIAAGLPGVIVTPQVWQGSLTHMVAATMAHNRANMNRWPALKKKARWITVAQERTTDHVLIPGPRGGPPPDGVGDATCIALWSARRRR